MSDWAAWKTAQEKKYQDENGNPFPPFLRYWLEYNGRTPGKKCETCAKLSIKKKDVICMAQPNRRWHQSYPACGMYELDYQEKEAAK